MTDLVPLFNCTQIYRVTRVEEFHGDLDTHYARDRMASVIGELKYSTDDAAEQPAQSKQDPV